MKWLKRNWYWLLFGAMALLTVYMDVYVALNLLDGDASELLCRGMVFAREGNPVSRNYWFTTELRLLGVDFVFFLLFQLTQNALLVRILGTVLMQALYVLSFLYMGRQAGARKSARVVSAALLLMPFSTAYARVVLYHLYYILYLTNAFLLVGLTLHTLRLWQEQKRKAAVPALLLGLLWVFVGLNGVRHMMIIGAPMLLFGFIRLIKALNQHGFQKSLLRTDAFRLCLILLGSCLCFLVGYLLNEYVLLPYYEVRWNTLYSFTPSFEPEEFTRVLNMWLKAIGARVTDESLMSLRGVALAAALYIAVYGLICSLKKEEEPLGKAMLRSLLGLSMLISTFIFILERTTRYYELYYVPVIALTFPLLTVELDAVQKAGRKALCLLCCLCLVFTGSYTAKFMLTKDESMDLWSGINYNTMSVAEDLSDCVEFMEEEEYTHALIGYWYANPMMELSSGQLTVGPVEITYAMNDDEESIISLYPWGTSKTAFLPENLPDTVLVFLRWEDELPTFLEYFPDDAELVWEGYPFSACEIPSDLLTLP